MSEPMSERERWQLELDKLQRGLQGDPFAFLGPQRDPGGEGGVLRAYLPGAQRVELLDEDGATLAELEQSDPGSGLFQRHLERLPPRYRLRVHWPDGVQESEDPYAFGPLLGELDLYLFAEGNHRQLASCLGAQLTRHEGVEGVRFAVWAPNAVRVSVVGDFNGWDGRRHPMRRRYPSGVWELFVPRLGEGELYKYELQGHDGLLPLKADPWRWPARRRPEPLRRPARRCATSGATKTGWPGARSARAMRHRCRSTKSTPAPGATATAGRRTGRNWRRS